MNWLDGSSFKLKQLKKFNASHNEIKNVWGLLRNTYEVTEIDLSYNKLKAIDSSAFGIARKLLRLYLSHNELKYITYDAFKELTNLEYVDLSDNYFRDVPAFPYNTKLKAIHLERNQIVYFNCPTMSLVSRTLVHLSWQSMLSFYGRGSCENHQIQIVGDSPREKLVITLFGKYEMHCNQNSFQKLYSFIAGRNSFGNVTDLLPYFSELITNLDFSGNFVGQLNQTTFDRFDRLITLSLSDTMLVCDFDVAMIKNQNYRIKTLDISYNNLKHLTNVSLLARFFSLINLNVAGNQIENVPELIEHLRPTLKELNLNENFVGQLNMTTFERFIALQTLKLSNTNLSIPKMNPFETLQSLEYLDISHNNLHSMNFSIFSTLCQLIKLNVAHCQIKNVSKVIQKLRPSIKSLDLSGNNVRVLSNQTFKMFTDLEFLNLSNTNIVEFNFHILTNLMNLQILDVSYNKLRYANLEALPNSLKYLHLEGNDLTRIDSFHRSHFPWLRSMDISMNQFSCLVLRQLISEWRDVQFITNPIKQKHGKFCPCSAHGVSDFLGSVYSKVKFW